MDNSVSFNDFKLTSESRNKVRGFLQIEEIQLTTFIKFCEIIKPSIVMDIGANVGLYTLVTSQLFSECDYYAFEPTPSTFDQLKCNIETNPSNSTVKPLNLALSSVTGSAEFIDFGDLSGRNGVQSSLIHDIEGGHKIAVNTERLDDMYQLNNETVLMKIDTEGHERDVLEGGLQFLQSNNCVIQIETGHGSSSNGAQDLLFEIGYKLIFSFGPDQYFSNIEELAKTNRRLDIMTEVFDSAKMFRSPSSYLDSLPYLCLPANEIPQNARIGFYGQGVFSKVYQLLINICRPDLEVTLYLDSFKEDSRTRPKTVLVENFSNEVDYIIIASDAKEEMVQQLERYNKIPSDKTQFYIAPKFSSIKSAFSDKDKQSCMKQLISALETGYILENQTQSVIERIAFND